MQTLYQHNGLWIPVETIGLDYESARDATPQWYGVSHGNGNDGVSHLYPDFFVRTADPYALATLACIATFKPEWQERAYEECETDGEAEYSIQACIYNPPDDGEERDHSECEDGEDCEGCDMCEPDSDWCSVNGAFHLTDVFPVSAEHVADSTAPEYDNVADCFGAEFVAKYGAA